MRLTSFCLVVCLSVVELSFAQDRRFEHGRENRTSIYTESGSALTVFSATGDQFFLMINGVKQNTYPQNRVRVEGLPQVTNDVQVIFNDNRTQAIQKKITFSNPVDEQAINLVAKIERGQNGQPVLRFHKSSTLTRDYRPEQGEYVMSYGHDNGKQPVFVDRTPPPPPAPMAMDIVTFTDAKKSISSSSFDETKLSTAKTILATNYVSTDQVIDMCKLFSFEDSKLDFAKFAYPRTIDPNNYFKVGNVFNFSSSKEDLNNFLTGKR